MDKARSLLLKRAGRMPPSKHGMMAMQGGAYSPMMTSARQPTAQERSAFNEPRVRQMMEAGATERAGISAESERRRNQMMYGQGGPGQVEGVERMKTRLQYGAGDAWQPEGTERMKARTAVDIAKLKQREPKPPKVYMPNTMDPRQSTPFTLGQTQEGTYFKQPLKGKPLSTEEQARWQQYWASLPQEEKERLLQQMGGGR